MMDGSYLFICPLGNIDLPNCSPGTGKGIKMKIQELYQMSDLKLLIPEPFFLQLYIGMGQIENIRTNSLYI